MLSALRAVSSGPLETGCQRCAWSCPLSSERFEVEPQGPEAEVAGLGVAVALRKILSDSTDLGWLPALFDERVARLTAGGALIPSFPFVEVQGGPRERLPPEGVVHQFVMVLVSRLQLSVAEIVLAYALVERARSIYPSLIRCCSMRPIFLASCVIACKLTRDDEVRLSYLQCRLVDVFDLLELGLLVKLEHQLLEVLHWRFPMGSVIQACAESVFRAAGDKHARRALGDALARPMLAPQVLAPWTPPMEPPDKSTASAPPPTDIQRLARGMATRTSSPPARALACQAPTSAVISPAISWPSLASIAPPLSV